MLIYSTEMYNRLIVLVLAIGAALANLEVEHALGGSNFRPAGKLVGSLETDSELEWQRPGFTPEEIELAKKAAQNDGLYSVRVKTGGATLLSSVPAKCLLQPDFHEKVVLQAYHDGFIEAFNYGVKDCSSSLTVNGLARSGAEVEVGPGGGNGDGVLTRPKRLRVPVQRPDAGPLLRMTEVMGEFLDVAVDTMEPLAAVHDPNAKPRAVPTAGARKGQPPPDERSWLQKNWLFVIAVGMMVLNVMAKTNAPPPQQGGAAVPAGTGGAARRG